LPHTPLTAPIHLHRRENLGEPVPEFPVPETQHVSNKFERKRSAIVRRVVRSLSNLPSVTYSPEKTVREKRGKRDKSPFQVQAY
jgi:hypothetical protein